MQKEIKSPLVTSSFMTSEENDFSSLEKVLYLKDKMTNSPTLNTELAKNTTLATDFNFDDLLKKMQAENANFQINESEERKQLISSLQLNRGDRQKKRFDAVSLLTVNVCLEDQVSRLAKNFIEKIEDENLSSLLLKDFRESGIYETLYHFAVHGQFMMNVDSKGDMSLAALPELWLARRRLCYAFVAVTLYTLIEFLEVNNHWATSISTALLAGAMAYMSGLLYGVINDLFAVSANLPYFLLGHQPTQFSFFISNDPWVQGIGWGVIAAQPIAVLAAYIFTIIIFSVLAASLPEYILILPLMAIAVPFVAICANIYANYSASAYLKEGDGLSNFPEAYWGVLDSYQINGLALMSSSKKDKANWLANSNRNSMGYLGTTLIAMICLILMPALPSSTPDFLPSVVLSTVIAAFFEVAALGAALTYALANKDRQIDNRYKLYCPDNAHSMAIFNSRPDKLYLSPEAGATLKGLLR